MARCVDWALKAYSLLVFATFVCRFTRATVVPFLDPGFFFDFNPPNQPVPIPVTTQCDTIHLEWGRSTATGPNPTAPYTLQIYTSTFIVPFLVDAGSGLTFDWAVPFAPGTQYQICMFDKYGITGGCQAIYTVIQNTTVANPTCQNVTFPSAAMDIIGTVQNGPISQFGWVDQCTDISIQPQNGTPPYTLTVAPSLHPPYNLTSDSMHPINWTVSLSWASPFFLSLVDSKGNVWANGPMHSGIGSTSCLDTDSPPNNRAKHVAIGAGVSGVFGGLLIGLVAASFFLKDRSRRREKEMMFIARKFPISNVDDSDAGHRSSRVGLTANQGADSLAGSPLRLEGRSIKPYDRFPSLRELQTRDLPNLPDGMISSTPATAGNSLFSPQVERLRSPAVYVVHHDGGGAPVTVYTQGETEVVELPPIYVEGSSGQQGSLDQLGEIDVSPTERIEKQAVSP